MTECYDWYVPTSQKEYVIRVGDKVRFVKNRYVGLSFGMPVGSVGKVIRITEDCGNEPLYQVQNPNWRMANQGICSFWIDEIEVI